MVTSKEKEKLHTFISKHAAHCTMKLGVSSLVLPVLQKERRKSREKSGGWRWVLGSDVFFLFVWGEMVRVESRGPELEA